MSTRTEDGCVAEIDRDHHDMVSREAECGYDQGPLRVHQAVEPAVDERAPVDLLEPGVEEADQERGKNVAPEGVQVEVGQLDRDCFGRGGSHLAAAKQRDVAEPGERCPGHPRTQTEGHGTTWPRRARRGPPAEQHRKARYWPGELEHLGAEPGRGDPGGAFEPDK